MSLVGFIGGPNDGTTHLNPLNYHKKPHISLVEGCGNGGPNIGGP